MNNEVLKAMCERRSVRSYKSDPVPQELIKQVVRAGTYAATGMNRQSPIILAVTNKEIRDKLSKMNADIMCSDKDPFYGAPTVIIVFADKEVPTYKEDGSLVMGNLLLAAHALGLGSIWIHRAKEVFNSAEGKALMKKWGLKDSLEGIGHCILGYGEGPEPAEKPRKDDYIVWAD